MGAFIAATAGGIGGRCAPESDGCCVSGILIDGGNDASGGESGRVIDGVDGEGNALVCEGIDVWSDARAGVDDIEGDVGGAVCISNGLVFQSCELSGGECGVGRDGSGSIALKEGDEGWNRCDFVAECLGAFIAAAAWAIGGSGAPEGDGCDVGGILVNRGDDASGGESGSVVGVHGDQTHVQHVVAVVVAGATVVTENRPAAAEVGIGGDRGVIGPVGRHRVLEV